MRPLTVLGIMLVISGIVLIIAGIIQPIVISEEAKRSEGGKGEFAGCVVIFFIPICFTGSSTSTQWVSIISILFITVFIAAIIIFTYVILKSLRSLTYVGSP